MSRLLCVTNILEIEAEMKQTAHQTHCYILKHTFRVLVYWQLFTITSLEKLNVLFITFAVLIPTSGFYTLHSCIYYTLNHVYKVCLLRMHAESNVWYVGYADIVIIYADYVGALRRYVSVSDHVLDLMYKVTSLVIIISQLYMSAPTYYRLKCRSVYTTTV